MRIVRQVTATAVFLFFVLPGAGCAAGLKEGAGISRLGYTIQVGAFSDVRNAERLTGKLQEKGIEAFYFRKDNGVYAVRFGDYRSREAARQAAKALVSDRIIGDYYVASPESLPGGKSPAAPPKPAPREKEKDAASAPTPPSSRRGGDDMGVIAARTAERFVGIPYRWGGNTVVDGMDCSGFARAVYNLCGVNIPRTSSEQFRAGDGVRKEELKEGDLVFFGDSEVKINHVGVYVGGGRFVHAPRRGDDIKVSGLDEAYFSRRYIGGRRYF